MLKKMLLEGELYDYILHFNKTEFKLHKHIVDSKLSYFNNIHNNAFNDSNVTKIVFKSLSQYIIDDNNMTIIFGDLIKSIYNNKNIFDQCNEYSFEQFIELLRLMDYFGFDYDKYILFEKFYMFNKKEKKNVMYDKNQCYITKYSQCNTQNTKYDTNSSSYDCSYSGKYNYNGLYGNSYDYYHLCKCKLNIRQEKNNNFYNLINTINPFIDFDYGYYMFNTYNIKDINKIIPYLILTPNYIIKYNMITKGAFLPKLLMCFIYNVIEDLVNWNYFCDIEWQNLEYGKYDSSYVTNNNETCVGKLVTIYDYYNDCHINVNNYKIIVNSKISAKSCDNFSKNMAIFTVHDTDIFISYMKYIYFEHSLDEIDNLKKVTDFMHIYKFMKTNKCINICLILRKFKQYYNTMCDNMNLYQILDYYLENNYISEYIEIYIKESLVKHLNKIKYTDFILDDDFNVSVGNDCASYYDKYNRDKSQQMNIQQHCKCNILLYSDVKKYLFAKCNIDDKLTFDYIYMLLYILRGEHQLILNCIQHGNFVLEDISKFPVKYQPFIAYSYLDLLR